MALVYDGSTVQFHVNGAAAGPAAARHGQLPPECGGLLVRTALDEVQIFFDRVANGLRGSPYARRSSTPSLPPPPPVRSVL